MQNCSSLDSQPRPPIGLIGQHELKSVQGTLVPEIHAPLSGIRGMKEGLEEHQPRCVFRFHLGLTRTSDYLSSQGLLPQPSDKSDINSHRQQMELK